MIILARDNGIGVSQLVSIAEALKKAQLSEAVPIINAYQPSLTSFDFERNCYDKRAVLEDLSRRLSLNKPFILIATRVPVYGLETSFCDLEIRGCLTKSTDLEEIKKLVELLL